MKSKIIIYFIIIFIFNIIPNICLAVIVDGYCYLANQTVHDSIKVLFQADSPTAVTDSTYTDSSGYYSIDLQTGVYDITYSHQWYISDSLPDQMIMNNMTLPSLTLRYGTLLSGTISGVLEGTLYIVVGNVTVFEHDYLIIEPGATILFSGFYWFNIHGFLIAIGTEQDSIFFVPAEGECWIGINLWGPSTANLRYCHIEGTGNNNTGLSIIGGEASVENCLIIGNTRGVGSRYDAQAVFNDCVISYNSRDYGAGINCIEQTNFTFNNCVIERNSATNYGGGVHYTDDCILQFNNCIISKNGANGGVSCSGNSQSAFTNCVIDSNWDTGSDGYGIKCLDDASVTLVNTTVTANSYYGINFAGTGDMSITYSDFYRNSYGNFGGNVPPFLGSLITTNFNGDSCDIFYNIFLDPLFYSTSGDSAYYLTGESPCIDAGDPNSPLDPDGTIADIGAFYFDQSLPPIEDLTIKVSGDSIILNWSEVPNAEIYHVYRSEEAYFDITGMTPIAEVTENQYIDENALNAGQYFYRVTYLSADSED